MIVNCFKREGLVFVLQLIVAIGLAQEGTYRICWTANKILVLEEHDQKVRYPYLAFEGMTLSSDGIPRYQNSFMLEDPSQNYQVTNVIYEPVPDSLLRDVTLPDVLSTEDFRAAVYSGGPAQVYLDVQFQAIRKGQHGSWDRVVAFDLVATGRESVAKEKLQKTISNSLLSSGSWYKIKVKNTGIYKLSYEDLVSIGLSAPDRVRVFGYGGRPLDMTAGPDRPRDMAEIAIYMNKGSDGVFNAGDYILFYAEGPVSWHYDGSIGMFRQHIHGYSDAAYYFLTSSQGVGTQVPTVDNRSLNPTHTTESYDAYDYYEEEKYNLIGSGRTWYAHSLNSVPFEKTFSFADFIPQSTVKVYTTAVGRSVNSRSATLSINGGVAQNQSFNPVNTAYSWNLFAESKSFYHAFTASSGSVLVGMTFGIGDLADKGYLDYFTINAHCSIKNNGRELLFRDMGTVGAGNITEYRVQGVNGNFQVWDISNINSIFSIEGETSGSTFSFKAASDELHEFVVLNLDYDYPRPIIDSGEKGVGMISNQNLHGMNPPNYIIIAPDAFKSQADRLADFHRNHNGLRVEVVSPEQIYNEFSSGTPDVTAIRDFLRYQYLNSPVNDPLKYVLLFGDGSFDNTNSSPGNTNYILTYQSLNSLKPTESYVSDDFFGLLDDGEGDVNGVLVGKLDLGIGRFPVKLVDGVATEAENAVDKVIRYHSAPFTDWRRRLCFVGDDGYDPGGSTDGVGHMADADTVANYVGATYPGFELKKIYLDAYPQVNSSTGQSYPDAKQELDNLFKRGMLVFFYAGHGSENQLSGEAILTRQDVVSLKNTDVLPLFITATCQFSRFDHVSYESESAGTLIAETSSGEQAFLNPQGGAAALLTTTRVVYSSQNRALSLKVMANIFREDVDGVPYRLGEIIRMAKNQLSDDNKLNFTLLGDPAMCLNYPRYQVFTDSINLLSVNDAVDTLKAFSKVTIAGHVAGNDSVWLSNFNGLVYPNVYDKVQQITTFGNDEQSPFHFNQQNNLLYRGKATVQNGRFRFSFIVPRDISYNVGNGKLSYYAENGSIDARGEYNQVKVGGTDTQVEMDYSSPEIELYLNNEYFEDGDMTNPEPFIIAKLFDENGINTTGVGIGHDIVAVLDDANKKPYVLNDYYEATVDDYRSGSLRYQLFDLDEGSHLLMVKAWDVFNNSGDAQIGFVVEGSDGLVLKKLINYPNPASEYTYFQYAHNAPDEVHQITLEVFDISGRLMTRYQTSNYESGFISEPVLWNLNTTAGGRLLPGVYPYRLRVTTSLGTSFIDQKMIIIR